MRRVAAIDCGTNSIRLLISESNGRGGTHDLVRTMHIIRLGEGVDSTGRISDAAIDRARAALTEFVDSMMFAQVSAVRMVATSATRDAENKEDFFRMTEEVLATVVPGARAEVISGEEEARLSFFGAIADMPAAAGPFCVIDLGGGSTEYIVGTAEGKILGAQSVPMGCVRLTERIMTSDPATDAETAEARVYVRSQLEKVRATVPIEKAATFIGVAGTFTTLSALAQGLEAYDPKEIHGSVLNFEALRHLTESLRAKSAGVIASSPVVHKGRADVIGGGTVVVEETMSMAAELAGASTFHISEKDILDGIVQQLLANES